MGTRDVLRTFNVTVVGQGEPTLVFAHGFGSAQSAWRHQVAAFAPRHRIVCFDHLGCGLTAIGDYDPRRYTSLAPYAEDLLAIYAALELSATVFVGHSVSALIGILAYLARPELFARMAFVATSPYYLNDGDYHGGFTRDDLNRLYAVMADDYLAWANGFGPVVIADAAQPELGREFAHSLGSMQPAIAQSTARVIFEADLRQQIALLRLPVLLAQSRRDPLVPVHIGAYMAAHIPGSRLEILEAEGHLPHLSAPAEVTGALARFLRP